MRRWRVRGVASILLLILLLLLVPASERTIAIQHAPETVTDFDLASSSLLPRVVRYIDRYYVDPERIKPKEMLKSALNQLELRVAEIQVDFLEGTDLVLMHIDQATKTFSLRKVTSLPALVEAMQQIFRFIQQHLPLSLSPQDIQYAALNGMLRALDPHSALLVPEAFSEFRVESTGSFGGLGMVVGIRDGQLTVIAPLEGTPAYKAGLKARDRIIQIEDESTINMPLMEAVSKLRGPQGTKVTITIMREGFSEPKEITLVRDIIKIQSVEALYLGQGIGYVKIKNFQGNTTDDLRASLARFRQEEEGLKGLILDLRNNPGGLLEQAIAVSDLFLSSGTIVTTVGIGNQYRKSTKAHAWRTEEEYPIIVLVNEGSASGSEIVAAALKNNDRAVVIGNQTFGKGSVQQLYNLPDGSALKLTVAQYLTPGDISIQAIGITPDIQVLPVEIKEKEIRFFALQEARKEKDLQRAFNEWGNNQEKPFTTIRYYLPPTEDTRLDIELSPEERRQRLQNDFYIRLATRILHSASSWKRSTILQEVGPVIKAVEQKEEEAITQALRTLGVDWTVGEQGSEPPRLSATVRFDKEGGVVRGGEELQMTITVQHEGGGPVYRLSARTESADPTFDNKEFVWGKLQAGESKSWTVSIKVPKGALTHEEEVRVKFREYFNHTPPDLIQVVTVQGLPRPRFAYAYRIVDDGTHQSVGNGDGIIQRGETIALQVMVQNRGAGPSEEGVASLRTRRYEEIFLQRGRVKIGSIPPGGTEEVFFLFQVREKLEGEEAPLELSIIDPVFNEMLFDKITLPVADTFKPELLAARLIERQPPLIQLSEPVPGSAVDTPEIRLAGTVRDEGKVRHLYIFVNEDKVFFQTGQNGQGTEAHSVPFSTRVKLKEGNNLIMIVAKDDDDLTSRRSFMIRRR